MKGNVRFTHLKTFLECFKYGLEIVLLNFDVFDTVQMLFIVVCFRFFSCFAYAMFWKLHTYQMYSFLFDLCF